MLDDRHQDNTITLVCLDCCGTATPTPSTKFYDELLPLLQQLRTAEYISVLWSGGGLDESALATCQQLSQATQKKRQMFFNYLGAKPTSTISCLTPGDHGTAKLGQTLAHLLGQLISAHETAADIPNIRVILVDDDPSNYDELQLEGNSLSDALAPVSAALRDRLQIGIIKIEPGQLDRPGAADELMATIQERLRSLARVDR